jgi:hypothetical protein
MYVLSHAALEMETVPQYKMEDNRKSLMMQSSLGQPQYKMEDNRKSLMMQSSLGQRHQNSLYKK